MSGKASPLQIAMRVILLGCELGGCARARSPSFHDCRLLLVMRTLQANLGFGSNRLLLVAAVVHLGLIGGALRDALGAAASLEEAHRARVVPTPLPVVVVHGWILAKHAALARRAAVIVSGPLRALGPGQRAWKVLGLAWLAWGDYRGVEG